MSRFVVKGLLHRRTNNSNHVKIFHKSSKHWQLSVINYRVSRVMEETSLQLVYNWRATVFEWKIWRATNLQAAQCAAQCDRTPGCKAIELWHKYNWNCYWCKRTDLIRPYTNTRDLAYPAHVWVKRKKTLSLFYWYPCYIHLDFCISPMWIVHFKWHYIKMCISLNKAFQGNKLISCFRIINRNL